MTSSTCFGYHLSAKPFKIKVNLSCYLAMDQLIQVTFFLLLLGYSEAVNISCSFHPAVTSIQKPTCVFHSIELSRNRDVRVDISNSMLERNATTEIMFRESTIDHFPRAIRAVFPNLQGIIMEHMPIDLMDRNFFGASYRGVTYLKVIGYLPDKVLKVLNPGTFYAFPFLKDIDFSYNKISQLEQHTFVNLRLLQNITFRRNDLEDLSEGLFFNNKNLVKIDFSENAIKKLPQRIFKNLVKLRHVDFSWNRIETLPDQLFDDNDLMETIDFKYNILLRIYPGTFTKVANIKFIDFKKNICVDGTFTPAGEFNRELFDYGLDPCYQNCQTCETPTKTK